MSQKTTAMKPNRVMSRQCDVFRARHSIGYKGVLNECVANNVGIDSYGNGILR